MSIEKLDFQKVTKESLPYTLILTKVIQNIKHKDALAVWVYLCSLPPDWKINKEHLKNHFGLGDRTLQTIFSYLNRCGLIVYKRHRFDDGTLGIVVVHLLCGEEFRPDEPYVQTTPQKTHVVELSTTPQKTTRVADHTSGSEALQKKQNTNNIKIQKKEREKSVKTSLSENFQIDEETHAYVLSLSMLSNEEKKIEHNKFYEHYLENGEIKTNWNRVYRSWMLKAASYKLKGNKNAKI